MAALVIPRLLLLSATPLLLAGATPPALPGLSFDQSVIFAGACLSPALDGCRGIPAQASPEVKPLAAVLEPRLRLEIAGLIDLGPQVTGGTD